MSGGDDDEPGLFEDQEGAPSSLFARAAELGGDRRRPGRPEGARNRKSVDFEKWFYAMGYTDPAQVLAEIASMDVIGLQAVARENADGLERVKVGEGDDATYQVRLPSIVELLELKRKAAGELMPYLHGKKPTEVIITDERLPTLIIVTNDNQNAQAIALLEQRQALSPGSPIVEGEASEIKDLAGDER